MLANATTVCIFPLSLSPASLGNVFNPYDNNVAFQDRAFFNLTITVPPASVGNNFIVSVLLTFNNTINMTTVEAVTRGYSIVSPTQIADLEARYVTSHIFVTGQCNEATVVGGNKKRE